MSDGDKNTIWNEMLQNVSSNSSSFNEDSRHLQNNHTSEFNHPDQYHLNHNLQQPINPTGSYTMLPVGPGNYLKVYHNNDNEFYDLFPYELVAPLPPEVENYHHSSMNVGGISNSTSMLLNQLVGNLGQQNISGTYSPFGEPSAMPKPSIAPTNCSNQAGIGATSTTTSSNVIESVFQPTVSQNNPRTHDKFLSDLKNNGKTSDAVKKQRIVAEVKPMRMSYSDVLSQNVSLNNTTHATTSATANQPTPNQPSNSGTNTNTPSRTQPNKSGSNHIISGLSDKRLTDENDSSKGCQINNQSKKNANNFSSKSGTDQLVNEKEKKSLNDGDAKEINKTISNKNQKPKSKSNKKDLKRGNNHMNARVNEIINTPYEAKKRIQNEEYDQDYDEYDDEDEEDDCNFERNESGRGYYNVMKNVNSNHNIEKIPKPQKRYIKNSSSTSVGLGVGNSGGASRSSKRNSEKSFSGSSRRAQKLRRNRKYIFIRSFFEKWLEVMVKLVAWLTALVSDVVVLSCSIVWDYCKAGILYVYRLITCFRNDLKKNPEDPLNWFKRMFRKFDQKFGKSSKIAFWRKLFYKKKTIESNTGDFYNNDRLPQTGDEAMYSLLNCKGKDAYSILGVPPDCSQEQIRKHYKKIAVLVHPDKNKQPGAEEAFKILQRAFELIGEPETRKAYDLSVAEALNAEKAWSELNDLLAQLQTKIAESANTIRCSSCGLRHPRKITGRPHYAARECNSCKIRHSAREGDIWAETTLFGVRWKYLALMEGIVYDITEWAKCQKGALSHLQPNSHIVQYRIVLGGGQEQHHHDKEKRKKDIPTQNEPNLNAFLDNLYGGGPNQSQPNSRRRSKKN